MSDSPSVPAVPDAALAPKIGAFQRLLLAFTSPGAVFEDIVRKPTVVMVLLALIVGTILAQAAVIPKLDMETGLRKQFSKQGMGEDPQEKAIKITNMFKWASPVITVVAFPMQLAIFAGLYFLALKLLGSEQNDFVRLFSGVAHAWWPPNLVRVVLTTVVALTRTSIDLIDAPHLVKSNLGAFLPAGTNAAILSFGDALDVLSFWEVALVSLAISKIGRVPLAKGVSITVAFWCVIAVAKIAMATLGALAQRG